MWFDLILINKSVKFSIEYFINKLKIQSLIFPKLKNKIFNFYGHGNFFSVNWLYKRLSSCSTGSYDYFFEQYLATYLAVSKILAKCLITQWLFIY